MAHPKRDDIREYVLGGADGKANKALTEHLENCEFCAELAEELRLQLEAVRNAGKNLPSQRMEQMKKRLVEQASAPSIIRLKELKAEKAPTGLLAADGSEGRPRWEHLKTFYCESPDVVLRLVRDMEHSIDSLQVIAEDPSLYAHVMVNVPDKDIRIITDENGHAEIQPGLMDLVGSAPWQIRLPEALFSLETLDFDPDKTEYKSETILTTDKDDRIKITFEGKTVGKQFSVEILQLEGKADFDSVHVVMLTDNAVDSWRAQPHVGRKVTLKDRAQKIILRLFQS